MKHAIAHLEVQLEIISKNEPFHRAEGNTEQADHSLVVIDDIRSALYVLRNMECVIQHLADMKLPPKSPCMEPVAS